MYDFLNLLGSWFIAICRLILLCFILFIEGLHYILFSRTEVSSIVLKVIPIRVDRDKLSYVDNLAMNNLDLMGYQGDDNYGDYTSEDEDGGLND